MRDDHVGIYGVEFEKEFKERNVYWKGAIYEVAVQSKQCIKDNDVNSMACKSAELTGTAAVSESEERLGGQVKRGDDDHFPLVLVIILVAVIVSVAVAIGIFMGIRCAKKTQSGNAKTSSPHDVDPIEGDSNVVMGRPIVNSAVDAIAGAPVTPHQPKGAELAY